MSVNQASPAIKDTGASGFDISDLAENCVSPKFLSESEGELEVPSESNGNPMAVRSSIQHVTLSSVMNLNPSSNREHSNLLQISHSGMISLLYVSLTSLH